MVLVVWPGCSLCQFVLDEFSLTCDSSGCAKFHRAYRGVVKDLLSWTPGRALNRETARSPT